MLIHDHKQYALESGMLIKNAQVQFKDKPSIKWHKYDLTIYVFLHLSIANLESICQILHQGFVLKRLF